MHSYSTSVSTAVISALASRNFQSQVFPVQVKVMVYTQIICVNAFTRITPICDICLYVSLLWNSVCWFGVFFACLGICFLFFH